MKKNQYITVQSPNILLFYEKQRFSQIFDTVKSALEQKGEEEIASLFEQGDNGEFSVEECRRLDYLISEDISIFGKERDFPSQINDASENAAEITWHPMTEEEQKVSKKRKLKSWIPVVCIVLGCVILFKGVLFNCFVPSGSMENTLMVGDRILANRITAKDVHRYDILIFKAPDDPSTYYIKRVIGMPGDTVSIKTNGHVYINDKKAEESFVKEPMQVDEDVTYVVPENSYFMMGDNRNNSEDSRYWQHTFLPKENIKAKDGFVYWPINHAGKIGGINE